MPKYLATNKTNRKLSVWTPAGDVVVAPGQSSDVILTAEQFKSVDAVSDLSFEKTGDDEPAGVEASSFVSADDGKLRSDLDQANRTIDSLRLEIEDSDKKIDSLRADLDAAKKGLDHQDKVIAGLNKDLDAAKKSAEDKKGK